MSDTGFGIKFLLAGSGLLVGGLGTALYFRSKQQKTLEETLSQRTRNYLLNTYKYTAVGKYHNICFVLKLKEICVIFFVIFIFSQ